MRWRASGVPGALGTSEERLGSQDRMAGKCHPVTSMAGIEKMRAPGRSSPLLQLQRKPLHRNPPGLYVPCQRALLRTPVQAGGCSDAIKNGAETDVDCGGGTCPKCGTGRFCSSASDCVSGRCVGSPGVCQVGRSLLHPPATLLVRQVSSCTLEAPAACRELCYSVQVGTRCTGCGAAAARVSEPNSGWAAGQSLQGQCPRSAGAGALMFR